MPDLRLLASSFKTTLRYASQSGGVTGSCARLLISLGGASPSGCREIADRRLKSGKMSKDDHANIMKALEQIEEFRKRKTGSFIQPTALSGWAEIRNGHIRHTANSTWNT